jgi:hypothetical protein
MDKKSDLFFLIILILVVISFLILNIIKILESYMIREYKI